MHQQALFSLTSPYLWPGGQCTQDHGRFSMQLSDKRFPFTCQQSVRDSRRQTGTPVVIHPSVKWIEATSPKGSATAVTLLGLDMQSPDPASDH